jgi:putative membrane protein
MKPHPGFLHRGGAALALAVFTSTLAAHIEPTPRLTPTPTSFESNAGMLCQADKSFLGKASSASRRAITVSQAVLDQLSSPQIKSFAQQVIADGALSTSDLMALAEQKGIELPARDESPLSDDWSRKTVDVDRQYAREMVSDHEVAVKVFEDAAASRDTDVAAFAQKTLPALQHQLAAAQDLQRAID